MLLLDAWPFGRAGGAGGGGGTATIGEAPTETAAEWVQRALRWRMRQAGATPRGARWAARLLPARPPPGRTALRLWSELELSLRESAMRRWAERAPQRAAVPATLFLSRQPRPGAPADLGWAARCDLQAVVPVEGDHVEMLRPPHRAALCAALSAAVRVAALPEAAAPEGAVPEAVS
jgi:thioesterase domain-containing protein